MNVLSTTNSGGYGHKNINHKENYAGPNDISEDFEGAGSGNGKDEDDDGGGGSDGCGGGSDDDDDSDAKAFWILPLVHM
ncbi:unnamed protein product [Schistocephalus solidus]|uniref:Uncharacterized protein n=1 Tax=Schistocephalus solidus TaxID=70667 RepID=A0A183TIQ9_SCHSO|nr:unnamed protein product [Schistocephalus solidus]